jgi:hypothetical protein
VTDTLGIACGLAAWQIVAISLALAVFLLVRVAKLKEVYPKEE